MGDTLKNIRKRSRAVPEWLRVIIILFTLFYPMVLVIVEDNLFDIVRDAFTGISGPEVPYLYTASYLMCVLILLIPTNIIMQLIGHWLLNRNKKI